MIKKILAKHNYHYELSEYDIKKIEYIFLAIKNEVGYLGGPQHWFEAIQRFMKKEGYLFIKKPQDSGD